jgi:hypothetical protein
MVHMPRSRCPEGGVHPPAHGVVTLYHIPTACLAAAAQNYENLGLTLDLNTKESLEADAASLTDDVLQFADVKARRSAAL